MIACLALAASVSGTHSHHHHHQSLAGRIAAPTITQASHRIPRNVFVWQPSTRGKSSQLRCEGRFNCLAVEFVVPTATAAAGVLVEWWRDCEETTGANPAKVRLLELSQVMKKPMPPTPEAAAATDGAAEVGRGGGREGRTGASELWAVSLGSYKSDLAFETTCE